VSEEDAKRIVDEILPTSLIIKISIAVGVITGLVDAMIAGLIK